MMRSGPVALFAAALFIAAAGASEAQGQGRGRGQGRSGHADGGPENQPSPPGHGRASGPTSATEWAARSFGTWSDDTYVLPPGEAWLGVSAGYWRLPFADQTDVPIVDATVGIARRVHVGVTLPVSNLTPLDGGGTERFLGDSYFSAKIGLRDADTGWGIAVAPLIEVLADGSWPGADGAPIGRVHWGVPVNLEFKADRWRAYGSAGYLSRGAVFGTGTLDVSLGNRAGLLLMLSQAYSTVTPAASAMPSRARTDLHGGAYALLSPAVSVYGLMGRTISRAEIDSPSLAISAGVSFRVHAGTE
jgi:hypothetical protein